MSWTGKDFDEHRREWLEKPTIGRKEVLEYLGISPDQLDALIKKGIITKYLYSHPTWRGHQRKVFERFEIIAFGHVTGLRT